MTIKPSRISGVFWAILAVAVALSVSRPTLVKAATNPPEIRICSQNLFRLGEASKQKARDPQFHEKQRSFLVTRVLRARCDVLALQEVVGKNKKEALATLNFLRTELEMRTSRRFRPYIGESYDEHIRNGFLVAKDIGEIQAFTSYDHEILPRLQPSAAPSRFIRAPIAVALRVPGQEGAPERNVLVVNFHLKSKSMGFKDPTGTGFETVRMEMAEAIRQIVARESKQQSARQISVLLGDRNSDIGSASAEILSGVRTLDDFQAGGPCKLDSQIHVHCEVPQKEPVLLPLFRYRQELFPGEYQGGSYLYKRRQELIDEIYVWPQDLAAARRPSGRLAVGMEGEFFKGSDHKLVWVELNW